MTTHAELQAELASLRATVQNAEIVMAALRERDALVRAENARLRAVATYAQRCEHCAMGAPAHFGDCPYATARAALVALVEGGRGDA